MVQSDVTAAGAEADVADTTTETQGAEATTQPADNADEPDFYDEGDPFDEQPKEEKPAGEEAAEKPSIDAPASLNAEEKEQFTQLPPEAQRALSSILQRRDSETQQGLESARTAQRDAERSAADRIAQAQRLYAEKSTKLIQAFAPQPPPLELARQDPAEYTYQKGLYEQEMAQFQALVAKIGEDHQQSQQHFDARNQEWLQEQVKQLMSIPEIANEATRAGFIQNLEKIGVELGYGAEALREADAKDIFALNKARQWKEKAEKWDAHQKMRNERPRAASGRFSAAPAGARAAAQPGQTDTLKALYPND